jgi:23S rRNA (adenine2503-C2)-methyltransferase
VAKQNLLDLDREGLERFFAETLGEARYRAHQVMKWIHHHYVTDFDEMTDLGKALRAKLHQHAEVRVPNIVFDKPSADGTHKWLLAMGTDGKNAIEAVYIPDKNRGTLCVSSQVGCALNCTFCSTATQGFNRNLSTAEIIGQVWVAARHLGNIPHKQRRLTNVVMMGMGEPLMNFDNVVRAMSLHAADDALRETLVPLNKKYPIAELMASCARYLRANKRRESVTFEYTLMKGINDQPEHARQLARLMRQFDNAVQASHSGKVNLIPFNPFPGTRYERSGESEIRAFQKILLDAKVLTMVRRTRGDDIDAACGQLKGQVMDRTRRQAEFNKTLQAGKGSDAAA